MKILHIIDSLNLGGAERVCIDLSNIFQEHGHRVGVLILLGESKLDFMLNSDIQVFYLRRVSRWNVKNYLTIAKICNQYDLIHVHMRHVYRYVCAAHLIRRINSVILFHDHYGDINTNKSTSLFFNKIFKPTFYVGVSSELTKWAVEILRIKKEQVFLLSNIVRRLELADHSNRENDVVLVSNIRRTKNIEFAIELIEPTELRIDIVGQVLDSEYHQELLDMVQRLQMGSRVRFIDDCYNVQPLLNTYKIALHTSKSETGPLVLMEYLAQGLNFLSYRTGEVSEHLSAIIPFFFMESFNHKDWTGRLDLLLSQPILKEELISIYREHYTEHEYYQKCINIYQKILHF